MSRNIAQEIIEKAFDPSNLKNALQLQTLRTSAAVGGSASGWEEGNASVQEGIFTGPLPFSPDVAGAVPQRPTRQNELLMV